MTSLPFDIIIDILLRLPLKPLVRLKLVCKAWRDLITGSESFRQLYFIKSLEPDSPTHTQSVVIGGYRCLYFVEDIDHLSNRMPIKLTWHSCTSYGNVHVFGSCNGLVCFCSSPYLEHFVICNPWTGHMREINCPPANSGYSKHRQPAYMGFGYDSRNDDYKIVVIEEGDGFAWTMFLYSLKANSWKKLLRPVNYRYETRPSRKRSGYFVSDQLHWTARLNHTGEFCIVRFNLCTEQWEDEFCIPVCPPFRNLTSLDLGLVHCCLCLTILSVPDVANIVHNNRLCDVWIMGEYGIHESWSRRYSFVPERSVEFAPVALSKKGSKALCRGTRKLYWYDHERNEADLFEVDVQLSDRVPRIPRLCVGSLVSIMGSRRMKMEGHCSPQADNLGRF